MSTQTVVLEAASKKKRGRPRLRFLDAESEALLTSLYPEVKTHRHRQTLSYQSVTLEVLGIKKGEVVHEYLWLFDSATNTVRVSLLAELGRFLSAASCRHMSLPDVTAVIKELACELCTHKPKTKDGVHWLKMVRHFGYYSLADSLSSPGAAYRHAKLAADKLTDQQAHKLILHLERRLA